MVQLEFRRDQALFVGSAQVVVEMQYGACLVDFYEANPHMRQDGVDGEAIFGSLDLGGEGWADRLCDDSRPHVACEVDSIVQDLEIAIPQLRVTYDVSGELEGRSLLVGPFPTPDTAQCQGDELATVRLGDVAGLDAEGEITWTLESFDPDEAVVGQGGAIGIYGAGG